MSEKARDLRNGLLCCLLFLACYLVAWPVSGMPLNDDFSYIETARVFALTGHITYNGWADAMVGWMAVWGGLFIHLLGFSFMAVKLSTLPFALGSILLFYAILRRFGITPRNAEIGTLTLSLSPLFLPLSASFMTDIPALFVILLCLYCCQRALEASSERAAILWLVTAAVSNLIGGTARQVVWLGVLVMIPCTGWLLRKWRGVVRTTILLWVAGVGAILYCMHWLAKQPYVVPLHLLPAMPHSAAALTINVILTVDLYGALVLSLLLFSFPVLVAWLFELERRLDTLLAVLCIGLLPPVAMVILLGKYAEVWPPIILIEELARRKYGAQGWAYALHHGLAPIWLQILISLVTIAALFGLILSLQKKGWKAVLADGRSSGEKMGWLLVPYTVCYLILLLPLVWHGYSFDRYVMGVMPCAIVGCIWLYQQLIRVELPRASVAVLVVFTVVGIAGTHDWFAWQRSLLKGVAEVRAAGYARTEIQAGFPYDAWTQVAEKGYLNDARVENPKSAYHPVAHAIAWKKGCPAPHPDLEPVIHARYAVGLGPAGCYLPSRFPAVHYTAWLPPFQRTVEIKRIPKEEK